MAPRVLSGMRPTGKLHLGHWSGALVNWVRLQDQYECFYVIVDYHALTSEYETPQVVRASIPEVLLDWLAVGIDPERT
ncbi:MAG: tryptophan--tRNA ligase, partial [Acidobacteria bacterium]|nr:tryptophan--tRNA ligase [Acidobacteriota bacterium]MDW7984754.1 tryptophan--tRNA ligase [Acidobacteriota bacterium]